MRTAAYGSTGRIPEYRKAAAGVGPAHVAVYCWSSFLPEEVWENWAQGVCNAQHDLCEAAGQHAQQVAVLWLILVHAAKVVVKASLENSRRMQGGKNTLKYETMEGAHSMADHRAAGWLTMEQLQRGHMLKAQLS